MSRDAVTMVNAAAGMRPAEFAISTEQIDLIKRTIMPKATDIELQLFINLCRTTRLDPLRRQIYAIQNRDGTWQFFASIDGLRITAERSGKYLGQTAPLWCGPDGVWRDVWLEDGPPQAAKVGVYKAGATEPTWGVARWRSYARVNREGAPIANWASMPDVMLAKCSEALALRKAFPDDLSGLYVREEMDQSGNSTAPSETGDQQTGESVSAVAPLTLDDDIKRLRTVLGWSADNVIEEARDAQPPINLRTHEGKQRMVDMLQSFVDAVEEEQVEQGSFVDADSRVAGEPGFDRHSA